METAIVSKILQEENLDLQAACKLIDGVLKRLDELNHGNEFKVIYQKSVNQANDAGIVVPTQIPGRKKRKVVNKSAQDAKVEVPTKIPDARKRKTTTKSASVSEMEVTNQVPVRKKTKSGK